MKKIEIYALLDQEIAWHSDEKNRTVSWEFARGFVAGLKQAKLLIRKARP